MKSDLPKSLIMDGSYDDNDFLMTSDEQIDACVLVAVRSLDALWKCSAIGLCKTMLRMEAKASEESHKKQNRVPLRLYWRFLKLYKESVHKIRTTPSVPSRIKSILEDKAKTAVATVQWLIKRHKAVHAINYKRHLMDEVRRSKEINKECPITTGRIGNWTAKSSVKSSRAMIWRNRSSVKFSNTDSIFHPSYRLLHGIDDIPHGNNLNEEGTNKLVARTPRSVMRNVYLPSRTVVTFQSISCRNDFRAIKTTAILAASSVSCTSACRLFKPQVSRIVISHLLLPEQEATTDTCIITNYSEVEDYMTDHQLFHIGYIYTEPRREAELCAQEAHELCRLRSKLPEAFAIVLASVYTQVKFVILTDDGYEDLMNCKEERIHPHNFQRPMVKESVHLILSDDYQITVMDFRKGIRTTK